jgi:phage-related protein
MSQRIMKRWGRLTQSAVVRSSAIFILVGLIILSSHTVGAASSYTRIDATGVSTQTFEGATLSEISDIQNEGDELSGATGAVGSGAVGAGVLGAAGSGIQFIDPATVLWSQNTVGSKYEGYRDDMLTGKWNWNPTDAQHTINAVRTPNGIVMIDNTRAAVALDLGIKEIPILVHDAGDLISDLDNPILAGGQRRFGNVRTWGEALDARIAAQLPTSVGSVAVSGNIEAPYFTTKDPITGERLFLRRAGVGTHYPLQGATVKMQNGLLVRTDGLLARKLAPIMNKIEDITRPILQPLESLGAAIAAKYSGAIAKGAALLEGLGLSGKALAHGAGGALGVLALLYGLYDLKRNGPEFMRILSEEGVKAFGTRDGMVTLLDTLSASLDVLAGGAGIAAVTSSWTGVGGAGFGAAAVILSLASLAMKGTSAVIENWDAIRETATNLWSGLKRGVGTGLAWAKNSTSAVIDAATRAAETLTNRTKDALLVAGAMTAPLVKKFVPVTNTIVEKVREWVPKMVALPTKIIDTVYKTVKTWVPKIVSVPKEVVKTVYDTVTTWVDKGVNVTKQVAYTAYKTVKNLVDKGAEVTKQVARTVYDTITKMVDRGRNVTTQVAYTAYKTVKELVDKGKYVTKQVAYTAYKNVTQWVSNWVKEIRQVPRTVYENVTQWVSNWVKETRQVAYTAYKNVTQWVSNWVREARRVAYTAYQRVTQWVPNWVQERVAVYKRKVVTTWNWVRSRVRSGWRWLWSWIRKPVQSVQNVFSHYASNWVDKGRNVVKDVAYTAYKTVTDWVDKGRNVVKQVAYTAYKYVTDWVDRGRYVVNKVARTVYDTVSNWVDKGRNVVKNVAYTAYKTVTSWAKNMVEVVKQVPYTAYKKVTEWVPNMVEEVKQVARTVYDNVKEWVPKLVEVAKQVPYTAYKAVEEWVPNLVAVAAQVPRTVTETTYTDEDQGEYIEEQVATDVESTGVVYEDQGAYVDIDVPRTETTFEEQWVPAGAGAAGGVSLPAAVLATQEGMAIAAMSAASEKPVEIVGAVVGAGENVLDMVGAAAGLIKNAIAHPVITLGVLKDYGYDVATDPLKVGGDLASGYLDDISSRWGDGDRAFDRGRATGYLGFDVLGLFAGGASAAKSVAKEVAEKVAKETAEKVAKEAAERTAKEVAEKVSKNIAVAATKLTATPQSLAGKTQLINDLTSAAQVVDRGGFTVGGRSLTKHGVGARPGNKLFPAATGSPKEINEQAARVVQEILEDSGTVISKKPSGRFGEILEVTAPDGRYMVYEVKTGALRYFGE